MISSVFTTPRYFLEETFAKIRFSVVTSKCFAWKLFPFYFFFFPFFAFLLDLTLDLVEAFAIYANHGTLADEGVRVYLLDEAEDGLRLALLGQYEEHLYLLTGIETGGIYYGYSTVGICIDALAYFLILLGNDKELYASATTVDHLVDAECLDIEYYISIEYFLPVVDYKVAGGNDENITYHDDSAQRDVAILIDDGCYDICSSRRTARRKTESDTASAKYCS